MHFSLLSTIFLLTTSLAAPIKYESNTELSRRGPNIGGNCWVLRKPNGSTSYSNRYLGPKSHFRIGCMQGEREARRKEAAERKHRLEDEIKDMPLSETQLACWKPAATETKVEADASDSQQKLLEASNSEVDAEQLVKDRIFLVDHRKSITECQNRRHTDKKWGSIGFGTERACKGDIGRLSDVEFCLRKLRDYPGPYM